MRQGRYKYIRTLVEDEIEELYDLEQDPAEQVNLAMRDEHQARLVEFRELLLAELRRTESGMIEHLPPPRSATN